MNEYITKNEIAFHDKDRAFEVAKALMDENYVVMLSVEEQLIILNYEWGGLTAADRNSVVFRSREDFEMEFFETDDCE